MESSTTARILLRSPHVIPTMHHTQRSPPMDLYVRYVSDKGTDASLLPPVIQLGVDTIPHVDGKIVVMTPKEVTLHLDHPEWTNVAIQPQQLSYHMGCDFQFILYAIDQDKDQVIPYITSQKTTLRSKPIVGDRKKGEEQSTTPSVTAKDLQLWIKASVEYMTIASQKGEKDQPRETPIQQLLVERYLNMNL